MQMIEKLALNVTAMKRAYVRRHLTQGMTKKQRGRLVEHLKKREKTYKRKRLKSTLIGGGIGAAAGAGDAYALTRKGRKKEAAT